MCCTLSEANTSLALQASIPCCSQLQPSTSILPLACRSSSCIRLFANSSSLWSCTRCACCVCSSLWVRRNSASVTSLCFLSIPTWWPQEKRQPCGSSVILIQKYSKVNLEILPVSTQGWEKETPATTMIVKPSPLETC